MLALLGGLLSLGLVISSIVISVIGFLWCIKVICMTIGYIITLLIERTEAPSIPEFIKEWEKL